MSVLTPTQIIAPQQLTNSVATYHTVASNTVTVVRRITMTNTTAGAQTVTLHYVPSGGSATAANKILDVYSIAAHTADSPPEVEGIVLGVGDTIQMLSSAATSITIIGAATVVVG